jgi:hypothetical protein
MVTTAERLRGRKLMAPNLMRSDIHIVTNRFYGISFDVAKKRAAFAAPLRWEENAPDERCTPTLRCRGDGAS